MTALGRRLLKWLVASSAFLTGVSLTGCAHQSQPTTMPSPVAEAPQPATPDPKAPAINLFGEVDGAPRANSPAGADASFQQHTFLDEGYDANVAVDPTGKFIAFASTRHSEHSNLYLQKVGGTSVTQLTSGEADDAYPTFSPDGKHIAFCSTRSGNWDLYVMDTDGRNVTQVTTGPMQDVHPSFSPDGTRLVYSSLGSRSNQWELWIVNLSTNERKMIGYGLFPSWSPNKTADRIAFQRARARGSRWFSVWTLDLVDGEARHITEVAASSNAALICPTWSPDGQSLAFTSVVGPAGASAAKGATQQDIWVMDVDGGHRRRLTDGIGANLSPCFAVDNSVYFISDRGGNECVWSVQAKPDPAAAPVATDHPSKANAAEAVGSADTHEVTH